MMLAPPSERFKADFFVDLHRIRGPALDSKFPPWVSRGDEQCVNIMIEKYDKKVIKAVTEFRDLAAMYRMAERSNKVARFMSEFDRFLSEPERRIDDIHVPGASFAREAREIGRSARRLLAQIEEIDLEDVGSDEELIIDLQRLAYLINSKLESALLNVPHRSSK